MNGNFFANRITELRIEHNVSEQKMSYELGKSKTYIWSIASKKAYPSMELFFEICEYLNVTPAEFFEPLAKDENLEMIKMFNLLNDEEKMFVNRIIHTLIAQKE